MGVKEYCFRNFPSTLASEAKGVCSSHGAKVPLPANSQENDDFYSVIKSKGLGQAWLGMNDVGKCFSLEGELP